MMAIVLSYQTWQRHFGGNPSIIGRSLIEPFSGDPIRVVGVAPPGFTYPTGFEAWLVWVSDSAQRAGKSTSSRGSQRT